MSKTAYQDYNIKEFLGKTAWGDTEVGFLRNATYHLKRYHTRLDEKTFQLYMREVEFRYNAYKQRKRITYFLYGLLRNFLKVKCTLSFRGTTLGDTSF